MTAPLTPVHAWAMTASVPELKAHLRRSLNRLGTTERVFLGSPGERFTANAILNAVAWRMTDNDGGRPVDLKSVQLYEAACQHERPDGKCNTADLLRVRDELFGDDASVSRKPDNLQSRYENGKALTKIRDRDDAAFALSELRQYIANEEQRLADLEQQRVAIEKLAREAAEDRAAATRTLERNREVLTEIVLARKAPQPPPN